MPTENKSNATIRMAWLVVILLFPVALLNYLDRQMIAAMKTSVMSDVSGITGDEQWGYMLGQFKWCYAVFSPIGGLLADRVSRRWTIGVSLICWSAITFLTGLVDSYSGLLWTRTAMGISEAFYIPAALALIADYHSGPTRSKAVGIHQMGIYLGVILGGFAGYAADAPNIGWRMTFQVIGIFGILYAIPLLMMLRDMRPSDETLQGSGSTNSKAPHSAVAASDRSRDAARLHEQDGTMTGRDGVPASESLITNFSFLLLIAYFTLPAMSAWVIRDWMPSILKSHLDISQGKAGVSSTFYFQIASIVAAFFAGWLADRWIKRTIRGRIYASVIGPTLMIPALLAVGFAVQERSLFGVIAALTLFGAGWAFFDTNNMPILCQIVRPQQRATCYGIMNFVSITGGGFADWGVGRMNDAKTSPLVIFSLFAACCLVSIVLVLLIRPRYASVGDASEHS